MITKEQAIELVSNERERQDDLWGYPQVHHPMEWLSILMEEVGELAEAANEAFFNGDECLDGFIEEAVEVSAVSLAIVEHFKEPLEIKEEKKRHSYQSIDDLLKKWKQDRFLNRTEAMKIAEDLRVFLCMTHFRFSVTDTLCGSAIDSSILANRRLDLLHKVIGQNDVQLYIIEKAAELCEKNLNDEIAMMEESVASLRQKEPTDA